MLSLILRKTRTEYHSYIVKLLLSKRQSKGVCSVSHPHLGKIWVCSRIIAVDVVLLLLIQL